MVQPESFNPYDRTPHEVHITEKAKFSWQIVVTIVSVAINLAVTAYQINAVEKKVDSHEKKLDRIKEDIGKLNTNVKVLDVKKRDKPGY